ncbi:hypothetical protein HYE82_03515 [Streptomyces sp. BR123]|uniref:hypothetical protein n=1 Tax=Streptomyces sp. BR123 TaxID=2749828 RepID=UPI0015C4AD2E|nr:hypothetical protein [Streptomyces sp. BR123]NXY93490.1 hypothetical protein [Streptomyces sp. BR123]
MNADSWIQIGASSVATIAAAFAGRAARRTRRQEDRDDFTAIKDALNGRIDCLEADMDKQRRLVGDQTEALTYVVARVRSLVSYIRKAGLEPPAAPPIPERARDYLHHIDI